MTQNPYKTKISKLFCTKKPFLMLLYLVTAFISGSNLCFSADWPQWLGPKRDGVWNEGGILTRFPKEGPKLLWASPLSGGYAGPAIANLFHWKLWLNNCYLGCSLFSDPHPLKLHIRFVRMKPLGLHLRNKNNHKCYNT